MRVSTDTTRTEFIRYDQAARLLGVPPSTLRDWVARKAVPHHRLADRTVRFDRKSLELWIGKKSVAPRHSGGRHGRR